MIKDELLKFQMVVISSNAKTEKLYKNMSVDNSLMAIAGSPYQAHEHEPSFIIDRKIVRLSQLTKKQAKEVGIEGVEAIQKLKLQWRKDKMAVAKIKESYKTIMENSPLVFFTGTEANFEIKDGVCLAKDTATKYYNTKTKEVTKVAGLSRDTCEKMQNVYKKYATKLTECSSLQFQASQEYMQAMAKTSAPTYYGPGMGASAYPTGSYYTGGIYGGMVAGSNSGQEFAQVQTCEYLYGVGPGESSSSEAKSNNKSQTSGQ
jgi:hypothetical protein